jgi:hypothetical protein
MKSLFAGITLMTMCSAAFAADEDSLGLPGDQLDLKAVLHLFSQSSDLESFEKNLNDETKGINNLDLDANGKVDYIMVEDIMDSTTHAIVLRVATSETEFQDVAVIEVEKTGAENAQAQIVGDDELYGADYIVEASSENDDKEAADFRAPVIIVNVWYWPCVRFVYAPMYRPWRSPWRWGRYPNYWKPWRPVPYYVYHPRVRVYHVHYRRVTVHRTVVAHRVYYPHHHRSAVVRQHYKTAPAHRNAPAHRSAQPKKQVRQQKVKQSQPRSTPAKGGGRGRR